MYACMYMRTHTHMHMCFVVMWVLSLCSWTTPPHCSDQYKYGESAMHYVKHAAPLSKTLREKNDSLLVNWRPLLHNRLAAVQRSSGRRPVFIPPMQSDYCYYFFLVIVFAGTEGFSSLDEATIVAHECFLWFTTRLQNTVQPWLWVVSEGGEAAARCH